MNPARPRASILSLFDPLSATPEPSTPPRNISPGSDSDKENENPPRNELTLTTFFNRTYKANEPCPKPLKRRLIDVGDVTVDHVDIEPWLLAKDDSDDLPQELKDLDGDENETLTFRHMAESATPKWNAAGATKMMCTPSPTVSRTPLADLPLEEETTPRFRNKVSRRQTPAGPSKLAQVQPLHVVITEAEPSEPNHNPEETPLNSIPSPSSSALLDPQGHHSSENAPSTESGQLVLSRNSLGNSACTLNLPSSTPGSLLTETNIDAIFSASSSMTDIPLTKSESSLCFDHPGLRPNPLRASNANQNRYSIDLQSSFQLHIDSEATFDLINDQISFFGGSKNGADSYADDFDDPSFDMSFEETKLNTVASAIQMELDKSKSKPDLFFPKDEEKVVIAPFQEEPLNFGSTKGQEFSNDIQENPTPSTELPPLRLATESHLQQPERTSKVVASFCDDNRPLPQIATNDSLVPIPPQGPQVLAPHAITPKNIRSIPILPPPVVGLKIIKRTKLAVPKVIANCIPSTAERSIAANAVAKAERKSPPTSSNLKVQESRTRNSSSIFARASHTGIETSNSTSRMNISRETLGSAPLGDLPTEGARRVLVSNERDAKNPTTSSRITTGRIGSLTTAGPRRVPITSTARATKPSPPNTKVIPRSTTNVSRPSSQSVKPTNTVSAIPQPVSRSGISRLPAPSVIIRPSGLSLGRREGAKSTLIRRVV